jgi:predicted DNA-binding transcriptional regulator AlpA
MDQPNDPKDPDRLLTAVQTARRLNVSLSWLAKLRMNDTGPRYMKVANVVRYPASAVQRFIDDNMK